MKNIKIEVEGIIVEILTTLSFIALTFLITFIIVR